MPSLDSNSGIVTDNIDMMLLDFDARLGGEGMAAATHDHALSTNVPQTVAQDGAELSLDENMQTFPGWSQNVASTLNGTNKPMDSFSFALDAGTQSAADFTDWSQIFEAPEDTMNIFGEIHLDAHPDIGSLVSLPAMSDHLLDMSADSNDAYCLFPPTMCPQAEAQPPFTLDEADTTTDPPSPVAHARTRVGGTSAQIKALDKRRTKKAKYVCEECGVACTRAYNLREHLERHADRKQYHCEMNGCSLSFNTKGDRRSHQKHAHAKRRGPA